MKKIIILVCILAWSYGCAGSDAFASSPSPVTMATQEEHISMTPGLINSIGDILSHPQQYSGKQVEIIGYFRGWDLLHETQQAPPVSRNDWVVADASGAIYVTGLAPEGLDPSSTESVWTVIHLSARVEYDTEKGVIYLKAETVELVSQ